MKISKVAMAAMLNTMAVAGAAQPGTNAFLPPHLVYEVSSPDLLVPPKRVEFTTFRTLVLNNPNYSDEEKARKIADKYAQIERDVRVARTDVYKAAHDEVSANNSCTKNSDGNTGSRRCARVCATSKKPDMLTKPEWARGAWGGNHAADASLLQTGHRLRGAEIVLQSGKLICAITLRQSGRGRKVAYSEATFHIVPERIVAIVEQETAYIMRQVSAG